MKKFLFYLFKIYYFIKYKFNKTCYNLLYLLPVEIITIVIYWVK